MPRKRSILILTDSFVGAGGGAERHLQLVLEGLPKAEFDLRCIEFLDSSSHPFVSIPGVQIERWPMASILTLRGLKTFFALRRICRRAGVNVVLSYFEKSDILASLLSLTLPGVSAVSSRRDTGFRHSSLIRKAYRLINPAFQAMVSPSSAVLEHLVSTGVAAHRISIVRNGVAEFPDSDARRRFELREEFGIPATTFVVICVANLRPVKNHRMLLRAMAGVAGDNGAPLLVLLGTGPERDGLQALARELGIEDRVRFEGHVVDRVSDWLLASDVFALTSSTEGLSNALLEAQASGLPAVVTDAGGNPEVVIDGQTGYLVPVGDVDQLASKLQILYDDITMRDRMTSAARRRVRSAFSMRAMIAGYRTLLLG